MSVAHTPSKREAAVRVRLRLLVPVFGRRHVDQIVVRAQRRRRFVVLDRDTQGGLEEGTGLLIASPGQQQEVLGVERLR